MLAAIAVASPDLHTALARASSNGREPASVANAFRRYLIRAATRPTPYGLFAGVGLIGWGDTTDLRIGSSEPRTRSRPEMKWLSDLVSSLERDPDVRRAVRLVANPSVLVRGGRAFLLESGTDGGSIRVSLRATAPVRRALNLARTPVAYEDLATALVGATGASRAKVDRLLDEVCEHDVLHTDLRPTLTGGDPARSLLARLGDAPAATADLETVLRELDRWDASPIHDRADSQPAQPFATDMALPFAGSRVHKAVARDAAIAAELLARVSRHPGGPPHLAPFREAFVARYGEDRAVPLLELLDPQFGLGPPNPEVAGALERDRALVDIAAQALADRRLVVELDDALLERLQTWSPAADTAPRSLDVSVFVAARSGAALDAGDYRLIVGDIAGAGRTAGRFGELLGGAAVEALREAADAEAHAEPHVLHAELVFAPIDPRAANIAVRPAIRSHEIVIGAFPGVSWDRVIPLDELLVTVEASRFHIRWSRGDADVVAVQGDMLARHQMPPTARFLLDVAADGRVQPGGFDWGAAASFPFLPRVARGRLVLSPARWRIPATLLADEQPDSSVQAWRARWSVPRWVYLAQFDNRLLLDLEDPGCLSLLQEELSRPTDASGLVVQEALPGPDEAWLAGPDGHRLLELVVPLVPRAGSRRGPVREHRSLVPAATRVRPPGSDWLYLKLYCPSPFHDDVISGPLRELTEHARAATLIEDWFFIRYADPEPHLRIRFHGEPVKLVGPLMRQLCAWAQQLVGRGVCGRFCFDTYDREVERYGGAEGMTLAEALFAADSAAVAGLLGAGVAETDRMALAVRSIDDLLAAIGMDESERRVWYAARVSLSRADGVEYRRRRNDLREMLSRRDVSGDDAAVLADRRAALAPVGRELQALDETCVLRRSRADLCAAYVHMHCNRLFNVDSRDDERLALALLRRTSESLAKAPLRA